MRRLRLDPDRAKPPRSLRDRSHAPIYVPHSHRPTRTIHHRPHRKYLIGTYMVKETHGRSSTPNRSVRSERRMRSKSESSSATASPKKGRIVSSPPRKTGAPESRKTLPRPRSFSLRRRDTSPHRLFTSTEARTSDEKAANRETRKSAQTRFKVRTK